MKTLSTLLIFVLAIPTFFSAPSAFALSKQQEKEVERLRTLPMDQLADEAANLLEKQYPEEDWEAYDFPQFVFTSKAVEAAYMIAVKKPELLSKITCVCFCDVKGHQSLLDCYFKKGESGGDFTDHAVNCNVCLSQAMWAFLWAGAGLSEEEIVSLMPQKPLQAK